MAESLKQKEFNFLKQNIIDFVASKEEGYSIKIIIDYLDFKNKVLYDETTIKLILEELISQKKISENNGIYLIADELN